MDTLSAFDKIDHDSVADAVVTQIETMILDGVLKEGTRLPSERDLAETMQVSRPKLREAMKVLNDRGLVQIRHGEGTFIADLSGRAMSAALMALYTRHSDGFFDYLEYRRAQEGFAARLAAQRATQADKDRLRLILSALKNACETQDIAASRDADLQLHMAVVDASHNTMLIHMMGSIFDLSRQGVFHNLEYLHSLEGSAERLLEQHLAIGQAIIDADADRAEQATRDHLDFVEHSFRAKVELQRRETRAAKRFKFSKLEQTS